MRSYVEVHLVDVANDIDSSIPAKGEYGATKGKEITATFPSTKAQRVLDLKLTSLHDCVRDSMAYFNEFTKNSRA